MKLDDLLALGRKIVGGYHKLWQSLGMPKAPGELAATALKEYDVSEAEFRSSWTIESETLQPAVNEAMRNAESAISSAKTVLQAKLGRKWKPIWSEAGFPVNSIKTPSNLDERVNLLEKLASFFHKHADWENEEYGVTSVRFANAAVALTKADAALTTHQAGHKAVRMRRDQAASKLRVRLRNAIDELNLALPEDDPRWELFGLESPAAESSESGKQARSRKAEAKAESFSQKKRNAAVRRLGELRVRHEKAQTRVERASVALEKSKREADKIAQAIGNAEAALAKLRDGGAERQDAPTLIVVPQVSGSTTDLGGAARVAA